MKNPIALLLPILMMLTACQPSVPEALEAGTVPPQVSKATMPSAVPSTETVPPETIAPAFDPRDMIKDMSLEEKVGQLFLARCPESGAAADAEAYHLGGYILFGRDFKYETPDSVREAIAQYQSAAKIPMLMAVDEEGGTVCRVSCYTQYRDSKFLSPRQLYAQGGLELIASTEAEKCQLLRSLGVNVNMAPVCDITTNPKAFMYDRSLGESPEITGAFVDTVVRTMAQEKIGSVLKHFPGYADNTDTHTDIAVDTRSMDALLNADLVPFGSGIQAGCGAILVCHTIVECLDPEAPASLSPEVHRFLREEMGFGGVIVTDDLAMEAITDAYGAGEAAVLAVLAGNDLLCSTDYQVQYQAVLEAVRSGRIPESVVEEAVSRILAWKYRLELLG